MSLSSRAVAAAAATGCPRLGDAARHGWGDTSLAKHHGIVALAPRLAFTEGQEFERRAVGRGPDDDPKLHELLGTTGTIVRFRDGEADSALLDEFHAAVADPDVTVILQGVLPGLYGGYHRPDLMIRTPHGWQIGEVKVYLDSGGDTPGHLVQSAATQTAVSIVAARRLGLTVTDTALIILASGRGTPSLRPLDVSGEVDLVNHLMALNPPPRATSTQAPDLAEHRYTPSVCEGACALAEVCRREAAARPGMIWAGDVVALNAGWDHETLLADAQSAAAPGAVQAGWDAAMGLPALA